jgi:Tfp pilus assembly protein PilV
MDFKSQKGTSLVEVIASVFILAIVVSGVVLTMNFSQQTILSKTSRNNAAAEAQAVADVLIDKLKSEDAETVKKETINGACFIEKTKFPSVKNDKQFTFYEVKDKVNNKKYIEGYRIKTAVYYDDGGSKCVEMTAFTAKE